MNILIVEDNDESRYMLGSLLKGRGYDVISATNGVEAIERLKKERFDMIISDILMLKMDGFSLCRKCKSDDTLRKIPFVFYTATYTDKKDEEFALSLGAEKFIVKPVEPDKFLEILEAVIAEHEPGTLAAPKWPVQDETVYLAEYNKRLIEKLEHKVLNLEKELAERKRAEKALRQERNKVTSILNTMEDGVYIVNQQHDIEYVNPALGKEFGPPEGHKCYEYFHGRKEVCPWCKNQEVFKGETVHWEWHSSKNQKTYDLIDTPLRNADGSISKLEIFRDITERKRSEEALRESEEKFKSIFEHANDGVIYLDGSGNILDVNEKAAQMFGGPKQEALNKHFTELSVFSADEVSTLMSNFERILADEEVILTLPIKNKKGQELILECSASLAKTNDEAIRIMVVARDITEREKAKEQVVKLAKFPAENPNPVLRISGYGTVIYGNKAGRPLLKSWGCRVGKSLPDRWHVYVLDALSSCQSQQTEVKYDGRIFSLTFAPVVDANYVNVYGHDITERKKAEETITQAAEEWITTFNSFTDLVSIQDKDFKFIRVNKAFADTFKAKPEELIGRTCYELVHGTKEPPKYCPQRKTVDTQKPHRAEFFEPHLGEVYLEVSTSPVFDMKGEHSACIHVVKDITERKKAEEEVRKQSEFLKNTLESLTHPFYVIDANDYTIKMANRAANFYNLSEDSTCYALTHKRDKPCDDPEHPCPLKEIRKTKKPVKVEHTHYDKDGHVRNFEVYAYPILDENGDVSQIIEYTLDITKRKKSEQLEREHQAQLAHALRLSTIGEMSSGLAHELNQPLCAIVSQARGSLRMIKSGQWDNDEIVDAIEEVGTQAERAGKIIRRIQKMVRKQEPHRSSINIENVIRETISFVEAEARLGGITIRVEPAENIPMSLADPIEIQQVLLNLLRNSFEAMGDIHDGKREITIRISMDKNDAVEIVISDTGTGLPPESIGKVFDPFFSTKSQGLGIGLSISRTIIELHGGRFFAESNSDGGATFRFTLPIKEVAANASIP